MAMVIQSSDAAKVKSFGKLNLHEHQKWRNECRRMSSPVVEFKVISSVLCVPSCNCTGGGGYDD